ncbi:MAG: 3-deoxy-7-phosphoheptulonate synthase, partial [Nanoarchaeota archaeon]
MIIKLRKNATKEQFVRILEEIKSLGFECDVRRMYNDEEYAPLIGIKGDCSSLDPREFEKFDGVTDVKKLSGVPYKHASLEYQPNRSIIKVGDVSIGGENPLVFIAGPCAVESEEQILRLANEVKNAGAKILRGGAWKPRKDVKTFDGLKEKGLELLIRARELTGLPFVTEVVDTRDVELIGEKADMFQVGSKNMDNEALLNELGRHYKPVLLKRGFGATIEEFLYAADRIMHHGNENVILCLRGIRTFDSSTRYTYDIGSLPVLRQLTHLPIVVDPSHAAGKRNLV